MIARLVHLSLAAAVSMLASPMLAITLNQVDDFQDGTVQSWAGGSSPTNVPDGGPEGAGDRYLELTAANFNLGAFNTAQWSGDYLAEAVDRVSFDLNNFGPDALSLRVVIFTPGCDLGAAACTAWSSTNATMLPSGSGWATAEFSLSEADMTRVLGTDSFDATMQNVERLLLRHDSGGPDPPGTSDLVDAALGVDDVTALPEPSIAAGFAAGALALAGLRRSGARLRHHLRAVDSDAVTTGLLKEKPAADSRPVWPSGPWRRRSFSDGGLDARSTAAADGVREPGRWRW